MEEDQEAGTRLYFVRIIGTEAQGALSDGATLVGILPSWPGICDLELPDEVFVPFRSIAEWVHRCWIDI